ncbi:hypothetical protein U3A55_14430 [Salarchaeum sp. III]|uniref:hypothetical protein n=1 Tax=Salarchaeum sp. III TaxID=3107927 RepID=UPI002ED79E97
MGDVFGLVAGSLVIVFGVLSLLNHPVIDVLNRWMKSWGTTQRTRNVELNDLSVAITRIVGFVLVVLGVGILGDAT